MDNLNSILIEGILVADPKAVHSIAENRVICEFTITSKRYFKKDREVIEDSSNFDVICYGRVASICAEQLHKDRGVRVVGRLQEYRWGDVSRVHIIAEHVEFQQRYKYKETKEAKA